eukprot:gnl/Trimastix_PCT/966.p1 GENE.gnl/Trimastix_PCT/966~~gnl/Trimastix_PCT/966.p1  ORF type:complete len:227 (-),score=43.64 gnl/Trimastix_PCT/966:108-788(-)
MSFLADIGAFQKGALKKVEIRDRSAPQLMSTSSPKPEKKTRAEIAAMLDQTLGGKQQQTTAPPSEPPPQQDHHQPEEEPQPEHTSTTTTVTSSSEPVSEHQCAAPVRDPVPHVPPTTIRKEGYLWKVGRRIKTWYQRWFVLETTGEVRYYTSSAKLDKEHRGTFRLAGGDVAPHIVGTPPQDKHGFRFELSTRARLFHLGADTPEEAFAWVEAFNSVIRIVASAEC